MSSLFLRVDAIVRVTERPLDCAMDLVVEKIASSLPQMHEGDEQRALKYVT